MCSSAKTMDDKYEEIGILELGHISNDEQSINQSKIVSDESNPADKKKVELGEVCCTRKLVRSMSEAMPSSPKKGKKKWKHSRNKSQKTKRSKLFCCGDSDSSEDVKEEQTLENSEGPKDWQIREWNAELRENERVIKEAAIQEKDHLLEIAIRVNEISLESK